MVFILLWSTVVGFGSEVITLLHVKGDDAFAFMLKSQAKFSVALFVPPGTLWRTLRQLLTHWHLLNLG